MKNIKRAVAITAGAVAVVAVAGCAPSAETPGAGGDGTEVITITVGDRPSSDQAEAVKALDTTIANFEEEHPGIKINSVETRWDPMTFQAMLAGGTMPTVMGVAFTEPQSLIANGQIADLTDALERTGLGPELNPSALQVAQAGGKTYGVPTDVYSVGLAYNRDLFVQAGLDPDAPPTTWDEVREAAKAISATGATGYATYAAEHFGGWMTTAAVYSFGGELQNAEGTVATVATEPFADYLSLIHEMRWTDDSMGRNFLYSAEPALQDFAAGRIGMILGLPQDYPGLVKNYQMDPADYGFTALPQATSDDRTLGGGVVAVFRPDASEAEIDAGLEWIQYSRFAMYFDETVAIEGAEVGKADNAIIGLPALSPLSQSAFDDYQGWIADFINVPLENFAGYTAVSNEQTVLPEPRTAAQEMYGSMDTVLQKVLTDQNVDIDALLVETEQTLQAKIDRN